MGDRCGWKKVLLPKDRAIHKTLCEAIFEHVKITGIMDDCRRDVDKTVIGVDGTYKTLMGILYQVQHGPSVFTSIRPLRGGREAAARTLGEQ